MTPLEIKQIQLSQFAAMSPIKLAAHFTAKSCSLGSDQAISQITDILHAYTDRIRADTASEIANKTKSSVAHQYIESLKPTGD